MFTNLKSKTDRFLNVYNKKLSLLKYLNKVHILQNLAVKEFKV